MDRSLLVIGMAAVLGLAACGNSSTPSAVPTLTPLPSASIQQKVCDIQAQVLSIVSQVQATGLPSPADFAAQLQELQTKLENRANTLEAQGATSFADQIRAVAAAVGQLATAVNGTDPAAVVGASAAVADALSKIPGCPAPSVSPSS